MDDDEQVMDLDGSDKIFFHRSMSDGAEKTSYVPKEGCHITRPCTFDRINTVTRQIISCPSEGAA